MVESLSGIKVLEYGQFVAAPSCTKLLADLGAEVIKIEEPDIGDEARRRGPFLNDVPHPERSGTFLYLNTNKLGITLNPRTPTGRAIFKALVREADILVENNAVGIMEEMGLDFESLKSINPHLVMTSITPFGQTGPHSHYKAYYLNKFHGGGEGYTLPGGIGWESYFDQPPIKAGGFVGEYGSGVVAALASLAAIYGREITGLGQYIDISQQEVLVRHMGTCLVKYNYGWVESRATRSQPVGGLMPCADGYVLIVPMMPAMWDHLLEVMGNPEWAKKGGFTYQRIYSGIHSTAPVAEDVARDRQEANQHLLEWCLQHTKEEIYYKLTGGKGCVAGIACTVEDLLNSRQLQARGFFTEVDHPMAGRLEYPSWPYKFSETPGRIERPAPLLGQHNEEIYCGRLGYSRGELVQLRRAGII